MIKQTVWILICLSGLLFWGNDALAQASTDQMGIAPQRSATVKTSARQDQKATEQLSATSGQALYSLMSANEANPAFNMQSAISRLQKMGYYYPLTNFDANFPLVALTGDKVADLTIMKEAHKTWKANQASN